MQLGEVKCLFHFMVYNSLKRAIREGTQDRNLEVKSEAEAVKEC